MLVQHITNFITELYGCENLKDFDRELLKKIEEALLPLKLNPKDEITFEQIDWEAIFLQRWNAIADNPEYDYTLCDHNEINELWIKLAYDLSIITNKTYLQILIPTAKNKVDRVLFEQLEKHYPDCIIEQVNNSSDILDEANKNKFVFANSTQQLIWMRQGYPPRVIAINASHIDQFKHDLNILMNNKKKQEVSGNDLTKLLTDNGCYPCFELRHFYLSNKDNKQILNIGRGLFVRMDKGYPLSTYESYKDVKPQAMTIAELARLRAKKGTLAFEYDGSNYLSMWGCFMSAEIPSWKERGKLPEYLLPSLLKLVDLYFSKSANPPNETVFRSALIAWSQSLKTCPIDDVNNLLGQLIFVGNDTFYLVEILSDCFININENHNLNDKVIGIARWLCKHDAALIGEADELLPLYKELKIGPAFNVKALREQILLLNQEEDVIDAKSSLTTLVSSLNNINAIDATVIEALRRIYQKRWDVIKNEYELNAEFTRQYLKELFGECWVRLAQLLSGAGLLQTNYFVFLISSIRPTQLTDLARIRSKIGQLYFTFLGETYENFCSGPMGGTVVKKKCYIEYPRHVLPDLLELIDEYFISRKNQNLTPFREKLLKWSQHLMDCAVDDVNYFYRQKISVGNRHIFLIDVLLDLVDKGKTNLDEHVIGLARWLCEYDASFIASAYELSKLYQELAIGPYLHISKLRELLREFQQSASTVNYAPHVDMVLDIAERKDRIDEELLTELESLYQERWRLIRVRGQKTDYLRLQEGINKGWIYCAQLLSGAKYIPKNYYLYLMPDVCSAMVPIKDEPLYYYPLSHFIHADIKFDKEAHHLLYVGNCESQYHAARSFYKRKTIDAIPERLTNNELDALAFAHPKFQKYRLIARWSEQDEPICLHTILAVKELAEALDPEGLRRINYRNEASLEVVDKAFANFETFYAKLSEDEKVRLDEQLIVFNGIGNTFIETLNGVRMGEWVDQLIDKKIVRVLEVQCSAVALQRFACMVMNYLPHLEFRSVIEQDKVCKIKSMREYSLRKNVRDSEQNEQRIQALLLSLLTRKFQGMLERGEVVSIWGRKNSVTAQAKQMYDMIVPIIDSGNLDTATKIYATIIDTIVKPALADVSFMTKVARTTDTREWLASIVDDSLFQKNPIWESVCLMDMATRFVHKRTPERIMMRDFIEEMIKIHTSERNPLIIKMQINIKFVQLMEVVSAEVRAQISDMLAVAKDYRDKLCFLQLSSSFLLKRLNLINTRSPRSQPRFFITTIHADLEEATNMTSVLDIITKSVNMKPKSEVQSSMLRYLNDLRHNPDPAASADVIKQRTNVMRAV